MATSKTASFWLTEAITLTAQSTPVQATIDLGSYVDVGDQQALAIEEVDFTFQRVTSGTYDGFLGNIGAEPFGTDAQLSDLNPSTQQLPNDDNSLIASGNLTVATGSGRSHSQDL